MWDYTDKVMDLFHNPHNMGEIETNTCKDNETVAVGEVGSIACGDALRLHLKIDRTSDRILDARFQTFGCASAIASSSALTDLVKGITVDEALNITNRKIAESLGGLPPEKMHCSVMGQEALEAAISNYKGIPISAEEEDDSPLICSCFAITAGKIKRVIRENNLTTTEEVTNYIKAGGGCGSCLVDIDDLLAEINQEREREALAVETCVEIAKKTPIEEASKPPLTNIQKIVLIQTILEDEIRPYILAHGGEVELYDLNGNTVQVLLKGACGTCPSILTTLKISIEGVLKSRVSPDLVVEAI